MEMLYFRVLLGVLFTTLLVFVFLGIRTGRRVRKGTGVIYKHFRSVNRILWLLVITLVITEVGIQVYGGFNTPPALLAIHLVFAFMSLALLVIARFWKTGIRAKATHKKVAYAFTGSFLVAYTTGMYMLF